MMLLRACLCLILSASMANALSCSPPTPEGAYAAAEESEQQFYVVDGRFEGTEQTDSKRFEARFLGKRLATTGFNVPFDEIVTVNIHCFDAWCGGVTLDARQVLFLRKQGSELVFDAEPCPFWSFLEIDKGAREKIEQCQRAGGCDNASDR
ncbi:hypothetical protein KO498_07645 [Lentibacter algarum]|uniref:hypothetical protein n=1 Tax=Lentibacter algarum TaxID=576131 RepID=UPI001C07AAC3|nr:hypothetical protein [Lentibacter algarum]MBU2981688.1 hypothetical protein [Lentibacter algarum]